MRDVEPEIESAGARLRVIGNGQPYHVRDFAEQSGLQGKVYTDPERNVYRALGMKRGLAETFTPQAIKNAWRALGDGHRQTMTKGDPWQQGGTLVVSSEGRLLYGHVSNAAGDYAPPEAILDSLRA